MSGSVRVEKNANLGFIVFDQVERHNALTLDMWRAIPEAAHALGSDPEVRVVILRGAGDAAFVAGADISEFEQSRTPENVERYERINHAAYAALADIDKPVIAMIHGFCIGGGLAIALSADIRYAADDARLGIPAARLGLGYSLPGLQTLREVVGPSRAKEILFTAKRYSAQEGLTMGLLNAVFPKASLEREVYALAQTMAHNAPLTLKAVKKGIRELGRPPAERDTAGANAAVAACFESADYREGVRAFLEKRSPRFEGR